MATITVADSISVNQADRPLDARLRVASPEGIMSIESPYVGALVYCESDGLYYKITALKPSDGPVPLEQGAVLSYEKFTGLPGADGKNGRDGRDLTRSTVTVTPLNQGQFIYPGMCYLAHADTGLTLKFAGWSRLGEEWSSLYADLGPQGSLSIEGGTLVGMPKPGLRNYLQIKGFMGQIRAYVIETYKEEENAG